MDGREETIASYHCVKCRNNAAIVRKVNLNKGILPELLIRGGGTYRFITCSLCGYTEIYDLAICAKNSAPAPVKDESASLAPGT